MNLIINTTTKKWHISTMETLGKDEILIKDYDVSNIDLANSQFYKVNDTFDGLIEDLEAQVKAQSKAFNDAILVHLDAQCSSLGFTGDSSTRPYRSVANYVGFDNVFRVDAEKLGSWIALTFQTAEQIEADVLSGARPMPTIDEVLAELPKYN